MSDADRLATLNTLLEHSEKQRNEALRQLQELRARAQAAHDKAQQLGSYREEYRQRWTTQFAIGTTVDILGCYQNFGGRLEQAINSQNNVATHADANVQRAETKLLECEQRLAAVRKLIERRQIEYQRLEQHREQKSTDEQAARTALSSRNPMMRTPV